MIRIALVAVLAVAVGCKSKSKAPDQGPTGSGSAMTKKPDEPPKPTGTPTPTPTGDVPALKWTDAEGELLLSTGEGTKLQGPCGLTGTITPTEVELGAGGKQNWNVIERSDRKFSLPRLDWVIQVAADGTVSHKRGGTETPLGRVEGIDNDAKLTWFGALVIAAPMVQHKVGIESPDGATKLYVQGAADLRAWDARGATGEKIAHKLRDDPRPVFATKAAFDQSKVSVTRDAGSTYIVDVKRDDDAVKAAFDADRYTIVEDKGELTLKDYNKKPSTPFAKLTSRAACRAHDGAVTALIWTYLGTEGMTKRLAAKPTK